MSGERAEFELDSQVEPVEEARHPPQRRDITDTRMLAGLTNERREGELRTVGLEYPHEIKKIEPAKDG